DEPRRFQLGQHWRHTLRLTVAPLAQTNVRLGSMENLWCRGFSVAQKIDTCQFRVFRRNRTRFGWFHLLFWFLMDSSRMACAFVASRGLEPAYAYEADRSDPPALWRRS